jgi:predicted alpha/beta-fold hydrolase
MSSVLEKLKIPPFKPLPMMADGKTQTVMNLFYPYNPFIPQPIPHRIKLSDGDVVVLSENQPLLFRDRKRIILLVHGLSGDQSSAYMVRATQHFLQQGYHVFRLNLRGSGPGRGLAKLPYHSGRSEDTREVIQWISERYAGVPISLIGFSLGANIVLKMAGEDAHHPTGNFDSAIAVSPPIDVRASSMSLIQPQNRLFDQYFVKRLVMEVKAQEMLFPDLPKTQFRPNMTIYDFDDVFTAPICGFKNADDYYAKASSGPYIKDISVPCLILHAEDDPVVSNAPFATLPEKDNIDVVLTKHGGHVAWLGASGHFWRYGNHWMDRVIVEWVNGL